MKKFKKIIDISLPIYPGMINYPNNPKVKFKRMKVGSLRSSEITELTLGTHTGTHVDAPRHVYYSKTLDQINLNSFIGICKVIDLTKVKNLISVDDLKKEKIKKEQRIILKTSNSLRNYKKFYKNYIALSGEAADFLDKKKVLLVGIDYLSIKKKGDPDHRAHLSLLKNNIPIIEGLTLKNVKAGNYYLVALPLSLKKTDGAPARVILLK